MKNAGFSSRQIGAYLLVGLPDQAAAAIARLHDAVQRAGIHAGSGVLHADSSTRLWSKAVATSRYDLAADRYTPTNPCSLAARTVQLEMAVGAETAHRRPTRPSRHGN